MVFIGVQKSRTLRTHGHPKFFLYGAEFLFSMGPQYTAKNAKMVDNKNEFQSGQFIHQYLSRRQIDFVRSAEAYAVIFAKKQDQ